MGRLARLVTATATVVVLALGGLAGDAVGTARQQGAVVHLDLVDDSRPTAAGPGVPASPTRSLPTTVYLPASDTPAPLIVLAHGAAGAPEKFTELAAAWAGAGYVVAAPRFPLTNEDVQPPVIADLGEQSADVCFVLDEVLARRDDPAGDLAGRVDPEHIGLFGMSLGSLTVWGAATCAAPDALVQSDGATLVDDVAAVPFPVFVAHSDVDAVFSYADVVAEYDELPEPKYLLTLHGAGHATVGENTVTYADEMYRQATIAFWDRTLRGDVTAPFPASIEGVATLVAGARPDVLPGTR